MSTNPKFIHWWDSMGERMLMLGGKIPSLQERCQAAFEAGQREARDTFDLPEDFYVATIPEEEPE
jgi:hypothetical protein